MPFRVDKKEDKFKLFNLTKKEYGKKTFNSLESAISFGKNAIRFRERKKSKVEKKKRKNFYFAFKILNLNLFFFLFLFFLLFGYISSFL